MEGAAKKEFYEMARGWGHRQARESGLGADHCGECADRFVVKLATAQSEPARWTWEPERIAAFLRTAARNHAWNYGRDLAATADRTVPVVDGEDGGLAASLLADYTPEGPLMRGLFWEKIHSGLSLLASDQRGVLVDYHLRSLSVAEIAAKRGCGAAVVCQRLARARKRLRELLITAGDSEVELRSCIASLCRGEDAKTK